MKRAFTIAALAAGLFIFAGNSAATAGDFYRGGHHGYSGGQHGGYHHGGYGHAPVRTSPSYGYSSNYGGYGHSYGHGRSYQPRYQQQYAPAYGQQSYSQHGGLHLDIGRFHILGVGGHHH